MKTQKTAKLFYTVLFLASVFLTVYVMMEYRGSYFAVGASGVIFLITGYLLANRIEKDKIKLIESNEQKMAVLEMKLNELSNMGRTINTTIKKGDTVHGEKAAGMGETQKFQEQLPFDAKKLIETQVNLAKMITKYEKENARQLALIIKENTDRIVGSLEDVMENLKPELENVLGQVVKSGGGNYQNTNNMDALYAAVAEEVLEPRDAFGRGSEEIFIPELEVNVPEGELEADVPEGAPLPGSSEPEPIPEPAPAPVLNDDPNHAMTPDEIAALIASMAGEPAAETPEMEANVPEEEVPLPEFGEPEPIPEPAPALVLNDDPNHAMTPDEIAALIASMGK